MGTQAIQDLMDSENVMKKKSEEEPLASLWIQYNHFIYIIYQYINTFITWYSIIKEKNYKHCCLSVY